MCGINLGVPVAIELSVMPLHQESRWSRQQMVLGDVATCQCNRAGSTGCMYVIHVLWRWFCQTDVGIEIFNPIFNHQSRLCACLGGTQAGGEQAGQGRGSSKAGSPMRAWSPSPLSRASSAAKPLSPTTSPLFRYSHVTTTLLQNQCLNAYKLSDVARSSSMKSC